MLAAEFGSGQVLWSILWFSLFVLWIYLLITVLSDIMRSPDLSGWGKGIWAIGIIILPYLGIFLYLIINGGRMGGRIQSNYAPAPPPPAPGAQGEEAAKLAELHHAGALTDDEYERAKARLNS